MKHTTFSVDVAKSVFEIAESDRPGHVVRTHCLSRLRFETFFATRPPATIVLEACGSTHHWGRRLESQGRRVALLPPHAVRPFRGTRRTKPTRRRSSKRSAMKRSDPSP